MHGIGDTATELPGFGASMTLKKEPDFALSDRTVVKKRDDNPAGAEQWQCLAQWLAGHAGSPAEMLLARPFTDRFNEVN